MLRCVLRLPAATRLPPALRSLPGADRAPPALYAASLALRGHARCLCSSEPTKQGITGAKESREQRRRQFDATAGKPTAVCDPYENKGQPLSEAQCAEMLPSLSEAWTLVEDVRALTREVEVDNFMRGAEVLKTVAAVAFNDGHFPLLTLERRLGRGKRWQEVVVIKCQTVVLGGLSFRDFQLAMLIDVELARPREQPKARPW